MQSSAGELVQRLRALTHLAEDPGLTLAPTWQLTDGPLSVLGNRLACPTPVRLTAEHPSLQPQPLFPFYSAWDPSPWNDSTRVQGVLSHLS